ncbi:MAG: hypothetical protein EXR72_04995 [Myxococcales bacterium]|nr:hypothetical protein [Myxococcales bacterium]
MTSRISRAFVDQVEAGVATLLIDGTPAKVPASLLPEGVGEGAWIELSVCAIPTPPEAADSEALRRRLSSSDDGGDFKL